jgi:WhiB family transcriptional regulator, redox-sensing transcriptional regulator
MTDVSNLPSVLAENWDWQIKAACRGMDSELFFNPDNIRGPAKRAREAAAKAVCTDCPVVTECLRWALTVREPYGVWGGLTPEERGSVLHDQLLAV